jgi:hypothetical protein
METVALAVGDSVGHTLVSLLRSIGTALHSLIASVVDAATQIIIVLGRQCTYQTQE